MSAQFTFSEIATITNGTLTLVSEDVIIENFSIDTRTIYNPKNTCYFSIVGKRKNGHQFIESAYQKGIRFFVISESIDSSKFPEANFIEVKNSTLALQKIAANYRAKFNIPIIGITGSNGKTTVKEWLFQLLSQDKNIVRNPRSYNSQVGVPLSVWNINSEHEIGIFEAGISQPDEMKNLQPIINPTIGVITNIGDAHGENFEGNFHKLDEKLDLFKSCEVIISSDLAGFKTQIKNKYPYTQHITWGDEKADLQILSQNKNELELSWKNQSFKIKLPFQDYASFKNCMICITTMLHLGYDTTAIQNRISNLTQVNMRLEQKEGINNCTIINDSYNSDLTSITIAIDFLNQQNQHPNKTIILSDVQQSGFPDEYLYTQIADLVKNKSVTRFIGIGKELQKHKHLFIANSEFYKTTDSFLKSHPKFKNETILIKGAREFEFEKISQLLQQKQHETTLEINLTALVNNYNYFKSLLQPSTKVMVMVKAYSYGSGSFEVANALQHSQVDYLAVAYADEGVELRNNGISLPIMVMNPEATSFDTLIEHKLEPEIYCQRILDAFESYLVKKQIADYPVHIKIDTGMNRLGFDPEKINEIAEQINTGTCFKVVSAFSHLVGADEELHDDFTNQQIASFKKSVSVLENKLGYTVIKHILNSNGIARFPEAQFDMTRLGIGIYGIVEPEEHQQKLETVYSLQTTVSQIKQVEKDETIGYSRKGIATKNMTIATLPIGYADGVNRKLGNGNCSFIINGVSCPTVGNICMDMCMIDVTDLNIKEGAKVEVFGTQQSIRSISHALETIPYEVLTGISRRVKRVYFWE